MDKGIATGLIISDDNAVLNTQFNRFQDAGAKWVRFDAMYERWPRTQELITMATNAGLTVIPVIRGSGSKDPTKVAQQMNAMMPWFVSKGISYVEFHNEPNVGGSWGDRADPVGYLAALQAFTPAVRQGGGIAVLGGIAGFPTSKDGSSRKLSPKDWFAALIEGGMTAGDIDAVAVHCYEMPGTTWWKQVWGDSSSVRGQMDSNGMKKLPILVTEAGTNHSVNDQVKVIQADYNYMNKTTIGPVGPLCIFSPSHGKYALWPDGNGTRAAKAFKAI